VNRVGSIVAPVPSSRVHVRAPQLTAASTSVVTSASVQLICAAVDEYRSQVIAGDAKTEESPSIVRVAVSQGFSTSSVN